MNPLVLVVEDDPSLGTSLRDILTERGMEVVLARDGEEALDLLGRLRIPDLVILDLVLPRFDGWNLLKVLDGLAPMPIIATSGFADKRLAKTASVFLPKPFDLDVLTGEVDRLLHLPQAEVRR